MPGSPEGANAIGPAAPSARDSALDDIVRDLKQHVRFSGVPLTFILIVFFAGLQWMNTEQYASNSLHSALALVFVTIRAADLLLARTVVRLAEAVQKQQEMAGPRTHS
jgi:hypothetical protein